MNTVWQVLHVQVVVFAVGHGQLHVLLANNDTDPPSQLPTSALGGSESLTTAAQRILDDHLAPASATVIALLKTYAADDAPAPWLFITTVTAVAPPSTLTHVTAGSRWLAIGDALEHGLGSRSAVAVIEEARQHLAQLVERTTVAALLCEPAFSLGDLQRVYEAVWNRRLDPGNFQRAVQRRQRFVVRVVELDEICPATGHYQWRTATRRAPTGRSPMLFTRGDLHDLRPPLYGDDLTRRPGERGVRP